MRWFSMRRLEDGASGCVSSIEESGIVESESDNVIITTYDDSESVVVKTVLLCFCLFLWITIILLLHSADLGCAYFVA